MITFPLLGVLLQRWLQRRRHASLRELDARALADIGIDASEMASIESEARGRSAVTRRRIASAS